MRKLTLFSFLIVLISVSFLSVNTSYASISINASIQTESAKLLSKLGVLDFSKTGSKAVKQKIKKYEYIALVVKMLGLDTDEEIENIELPYKDVDKSSKEYNNIKIAYKYGIISGEEGSSLSHNGYIKYSDALEMILNGLGFSLDIQDFKSEDIIQKALDLDICKNLNLSPNRQLTCGEAYIILCNALTVDFKPVE